jgi:hypothetical protein
MRKLEEEDHPQTHILKDDFEEPITNSIFYEMPSNIDVHEIISRSLTPEWRRSLPYGNGNHPGNSLKWTSQPRQSYDKWGLFRSHMARICPRSPFVPTSAPEWFEHQAQITEDRAQVGKRQLENARVWKAGGKFSFNGSFRLNSKDDRGRVLSQKTIWCDSFCLKDEQADWPEIQEMKWEGEDRAKTRVGRFMALPRWKANPTLAWHQCKAVETYPMDAVRLIPTEEDLFWPPEEPETEHVPMLLSSNLIDAIDSDDMY